MTTQLTSGIDTLVLALDVSWQEDRFFRWLESIKEKAFAEQKDSPGVVHYRDKKNKWMFSVKPYGIRGYEWFLSSKDFTMRIGNWIEPKSRPSIMVEISSEALWRLGASEIFERIVEIIKACGGIVVTAKISRVDLCMDILLEESEWQYTNLEESKVCKAKKYGCVNGGKRLETFWVGLGDLKARLYDKVAEIESKSKKYWMYDIWKIKKDEIRDDQRVIRVEFQLRREVIKELGAGDASAFFMKIDEVWAYCTQEWLQFKDNPEREHKYRNTLPWWKVVQQNFLGVQDSNPAVREKAIKVDKEQLLAQITGLSSSLTALEMEENSVDPLDLKIEPWMIKVIESLKLTGYELNEYRENVIRKRARYSRYIN